jgi:dienelactone hydrolase
MAALELPVPSVGTLLTGGMCLGGHLAFRAAFDPRVLAAVCFFGTDIHSESLGKGKNSDSLKKAGEIKGELVMIFGKKVHPPPIRPATFGSNGSDIRTRTCHLRGGT